MTRLKLMIVDDDKLVRKRFLEMLPLDELSLEFCCEADNGMDALALYQQHHPQIIIMDIDIPLMNGLELSRIICDDNRDVRIIVVTGYGTVDFAREAIHVSAVDFLLKPVRSEELRGAIVRAICSFREKAAQIRAYQEKEKLLQRSLPLLRERYLNKLLGYGTSETEQECRKHLMSMGIELRHVLLCTCVFVPNNLEINPRDWEMMQIAIQNIAVELCRGHGMDAIVLFDSRQRSILIVQGDDTQLPKQAEEMLLRLQEKLSLYFNYHISAGIGHAVKHIAQLPESFGAAMRALSYKNTFGHNGICSIENVLTIEKTEFQAVRAEMDKVFASLQAGDEQETLEGLKHFFSVVVCNAGGSEDYVRWTLLELAARLGSYINIHLVAADTFASHGPLHTQIIQAANPFLMQKQIYDLFADVLQSQNLQRISRSSRLAERARTYIEEHHSNPGLSIGAVSAAVGLSSIYFGNLFKKETGKTFTDYVNDVRLEHAKRLLLDAHSNLKVFEIAERVGYSSAKYFYQIFKKLTGQTPKQFSEALCK